MTKDEITRIKAGDIFKISIYDGTQYFFQALGRATTMAPDGSRVLATSVSTDSVPEGLHGFWIEATCLYHTRERRHIGIRYNIGETHMLFYGILVRLAEIIDNDTI